MVFWKHGVKSGLSVWIERFASWKEKKRRHQLTDRQKLHQLEHLLEAVQKQLFGQLGVNLQS